MPQKRFENDVTLKKREFPISQTKVKTIFNFELAEQLVNILCGALPTILTKRTDFFWRLPLHLTINMSAMF